MMAQNPVAAKEGGMKDYAEGCGIFVERCPRNKSTKLYFVSSREVGAPSGVAYP